MNNQLSGMRKAQEREMLPEVDLFPQVEYAGRKIDSAKFGPNTYSTNIDSMRKKYFHSKDLPNVTFKPLSTAESLAVVCYDFANLAKPQIFNPNWLQAGRILRTQDGVWANLPLDKEGKLITDENVLKTYLPKAQKIKVGTGHIYLGDNDFGFAENETFARGVQDCDTFVKGGLARVLEHTSEQVAKNFETIADRKNYIEGVNVLAFNPVKESFLRVVSLYSGRSVSSSRLIVLGNDWGDSDGGYALGGLVSGEASA